ncbi:hypothetical protein EauS123_00005 [Exiguobacterium phage vB_EauS-123]|nr:hypothetical protein EauS123_00005 [Exiguobacterium phage vB_EauS-123]
MNLAHIAETKYHSKRSMDQAEARIILLDRKIKETEDAATIERWERQKMSQIGIASKSRQTYMEMLYLSARLTYNERLQLETVSWS